jgi:glutamate decarboxylase
VDNYTVFDVSKALRERGWSRHTRSRRIGEDLAALRVVVRQGFTHDRADMLVADLKRQQPQPEKQRAPVQQQETGAGLRH